MKRNLCLVSAFVLIIIILAACTTPSQEAGEVDSSPPSAVVQATETTPPTQQESPTPKVIETEQMEEAPTPEAFETDDMEEKLKQFVIRDEDLPHDYRLPPNGEFMLPTTTLINELGEIEAKRYIASTGRVNGWGIQLERVNKEDFAPYNFSELLYDDFNV